MKVYREDPRTRTRTPWLKTRAWRVAHKTARKAALLLVCLSLAGAFALAGCGGGGTGAGADSAASGSAASGLGSSASAPVLRVAMELAYPPFETKDDAGNPEGISVDFIRDFGEAYGYEVIIENTAWDGLIPSLQTGKVDCIISSMTITEEREEA
ncbi:MAG: transporter substrate-binding domain-containing protein, partial [Coriobacteriales bacterium]|nr:transporter substrate-binding domain-containing protein [Coriobacteriales bacterium]